MAEKAASYDVATVTAAAALTLNVATSVYFYNQIKKLEDELEQVKKHLATIVPTTDPNMKNQIVIMTQAINELNRQVIDVQKKVGIQQNKEESHSPASQRYVRMTESGNIREKQRHRGISSGHRDRYPASQENNYPQSRRSKPRFQPAASTTTSPTSATSVESLTSSDSEDDSSLEEDIAAMM